MNKVYHGLSDILINIKNKILINSILFVLSYIIDSKLFSLLLVISTNTRKPTDNLVLHRLRRVKKNIVLFEWYGYKYNKQNINN